MQDTAWEGYEQIPLTIMQGYTTMVAEIKEQMPLAPTHVFLQAGVGSMAAAVAATFAASGEKLPSFVVLESAAADCFYQSFLKQAPVGITGDLTTIMAGLACGEVSPLAWDILRSYASFGLSCRDEVTALGMRMRGNPLGSDQRIIAGESGAVGIGALGMLKERFHNLKTDMGLGEDSVLLCLNTEGDNLPEGYRDIVWAGAMPTSFRRKV